MATMNRKVAVSADTINAVIESKAAATAEILKEVENNFISSTKGHITYHEQLMELTRNSGDMHRFMHHKVMLETYQTILSNYEASRRYSSV